MWTVVVFVILFFVVFVFFNFISFFFVSVCMVGFVNDLGAGVFVSGACRSSAVNLLALFLCVLLLFRFPPVAKIHSSDSPSSDDQSD